MQLSTGQVYHVLNKSIAGYKIFNNKSDFDRFLEVIAFYQCKNSERFSYFNREKNYKQKLEKIVYSNKEKQINIIAYCLLPTHFHFILKQLKDNGISKFLNDILNSYTRYFNIKYKRKGPLWQGKTKKILVKSDVQLLHLTRYIHLNPTTSYLVGNPEEWQHSSYKEYIEAPGKYIRLCEFDNILDINIEEYKSFVTDTVDYQRSLKKVKNLALD